MLFRIVLPKPQDSGSCISQITPSSEVRPCQCLYENGDAPPPRIGGSLPLLQHPRPAWVSSDHNKHLLCYPTLVPDLPLGCTELICLALHTTALQIPGHPTHPPLQVFCRISTPSPSATLQSLWLPVPLPSRELPLPLHPSGPRTRCKEPTCAMTSTSFIQPLYFDHCRLRSLLIGASPR